MKEKSENSQDEFCTLNPLTQYVVLQNLLRYDASSQAVLRNRLVSERWHEANEASWKRLDKSLALIYSSEVKCDHSPTKKLMMTLTDFQRKYQSKYFQLMEMMPPKKMNLHEWTNFLGDTGLYKLDKWFWKLTATTFLTNLTLTNGHFRDDVPIYKQSFLEALPNLDNLTLKTCVVYAAAVEHVNEAHAKIWSRRFSRPTWTDWLLQRTLQQAETVETQYRHDRLQNLDIELTPAPADKHIPLKIWGPLFAVASEVKQLRIDGVIYIQNRPCHFKELANAINLSNFTRNLTKLDLLDFSGVAQEHCFSLYLDTNFCILQHFSFDIGICPYLPRHHIFLFIRRIKHLTLYRAPFARNFPNLDWNLQVDTLILWGNVDSNLEFNNVGYVGQPRELLWNTSCYDETFQGKRIQHLLNQTRKAYPLFTKDLIMETSDLHLQRLANLTYLEIDFGPLALESWNRLGQDKDLEVVVNHWPDLVCLELKHCSKVSATALLKQLQELDRLTDFRWKSCSCTQSKFKDLKLLRQVHYECKRLKRVELPWKWTGYGDELVQESVCKQTEFENALLRAAKNRQFMDTSFTDEFVRFKEDRNFEENVMDIMVLCLVLFILLAGIYSHVYANYLMGLE